MRTSLPSPNCCSWTDRYLKRHACFRRWHIPPRGLPYSHTWHACTLQAPSYYLMPRACLPLLQHPVPASDILTCTVPFPCRPFMTYLPHQPLPPTGMGHAGQNLPSIYTCPVPWPTLLHATLGHLHLGQRRAYQPPSPRFATAGLLASRVGLSWADGATTASHARPLLTFVAPILCRLHVTNLPPALHTQRRPAKHTTCRLPLPLAGDVWLQRSYLLRPPVLAFISP